MKEISDKSTGKLKYSFTSSIFDSETFTVIDFNGDEGLSRLYHFNITLVSEKSDIDLIELLHKPAQFTIHRDEGENVVYHGILSSFTQLRQINGYMLYQTCLVPRFWWLTLTHYNQVFHHKSVPEFVEQLIKGALLSSEDYEFRLMGDYEKADFTCQFEETHFSFISRWLEREGIHYFFDQTATCEKIIFSDTNIAHTECHLGVRPRYSPPSGLTAPDKELVQRFRCRKRAVPQNIQLKDYSYNKPSVEINGLAEVDSGAKGNWYVYGDHFSTPLQGNRLAKIRSQELICGREQFYGESTVPFLHPSCAFELTNHYREQFNQNYLTVTVSHWGNQIAFLNPVVKQAFSEREHEAPYRNTFSAIPVSVQFRPPRTTRSPKIKGVIHAKIDGDTSGKYAELDEMGRYRVKLPFDMSEQGNINNSTRLRMVQPYAGKNSGMHFPLHKDSEVLLSFIDGNPDRPIISAAVPNPETPSPVTSADQTTSKITTAGGNKIHMEDEEGNQRILLHTPTSNTWVRMGSPNDPPTGEGGEVDEHGHGEDTSEEAEHKFHAAMQESTGYKINSQKNYTSYVGDGKWVLVIGLDSKMIIGNDFAMVGGGKEKIIIGVPLPYGGLWTGELDVTATVMSFHVRIGTGLSIKPWWTLVNEEKVLINGHHVCLKGKKINIASGTIEVKGNNTRVTGGVTDVTADNTAIDANKTTVVALFQRLEGERIEVTGNNVRVQADDVMVIGNSTTVTGDNTEVLGNSTLVVSNRTAVSGDSTNVTGSKTVINASRSIITAQQVII